MELPAGTFLNGFLRIYKISLLFFQAVIRLSAVNVDLGIWSKLTRLVIFLLCLSGLLVVVIWYLPLIRQNERMRKRIVALDTLVQKEDEAARSLKTSIDALRHDPKTVERLARERFGYAKPGETVIRFEQPAPSFAPRP